MGSGVRPMAELSQLFLGAIELVEIVLLDGNLRKDDLMRIRRVCRTLRVIVDGTLSLRTKLFLAPVYDIPPKSVGFLAGPRYRDFVHINEQGTLHFEMHGSKQNDADRWDFKIGTYYRQHTYHRRGAILITCETGIILGHLAKALETKSQLCNACKKIPSDLGAYGKAIIRARIDASNQCFAGTATDAIHEASMSGTRPLRKDSNGGIEDPVERIPALPDEENFMNPIEIFRPLDDDNSWNM